MYEKTYEEIKSGILSDITLTDKREGSFVQDMISPVALELEKVYAQFDRIMDMAFISELSGELLDKKAAEYGIYRRQGVKAETKVRGNSTTATRPSSFRVGTVFTTENGLNFVVVSGTQVIGTSSGNGYRIAPAQAEEFGEEYNLPYGTVVTTTTSIANASSFYLSIAATGGVTPETDEMLRARLLNHLQKPATSGNENQYREWAMEVDGIGDAKIFPQAKSSVTNHHYTTEIGSVTILPITTAKRQISSSQATQVTNYINARRPIGAKIYVARGTESTMAVTAAITIDAGANADDIKQKFTDLFTAYIKSCVFRLYTIDYNRCLSMFYDIEGVVSVTTFTLNSGTTNVTLYENQIPVVGTITITATEAT